MTGHEMPVVYRTARHGCWSFCACGWASPLYRTHIGVQLAHGRHLLEVAWNEITPMTDDAQYGCELDKDADT